MAEYRTVTRVATISNTTYKANATVNPTVVVAELDNTQVLVTDPYVEIEQTDYGAIITVTDAHGTTSATIYNGEQGPAGEGVPTGGETGQVLRKASNDDYDTEWATISSASFIYTQSEASTEWVVNHDLNKFPSVTVIDSAGSIVVGNVQYVNNTQIIITFCAPFSGQAILN